MIIGQTLWVYLTVLQFCSKNPAFTKGGVRGLIFNENFNGLAQSGAIVRVGRKVLINEAKFFQWLEEQNQRPPSTLPTSNVKRKLKKASCLLKVKRPKKPDDGENL
jgi:hypothetical protein